MISEEKTSEGLIDIEAEKVLAVQEQMKEKFKKVKAMTNALEESNESFKNSVHGIKKQIKSGLTNSIADKISDIYMYIIKKLQEN